MAVKANSIKNNCVCKYIKKPCFIYLLRMKNFFVVLIHFLQYRNPENVFSTLKYILFLQQKLF